MVAKIGERSNRFIRSEDINEKNIEDSFRTNDVNFSEISQELTALAKELSDLKTRIDAISFRVTALEGA